MKKSTYKAATIITVILCLATLAVAWTSSWFSNWNMADWSKKWETLFGIEQPQEPKPDGTDTPGGGDTPQTPVDNDVVAISGKGDKMLAGETYDVTNFAYTVSSLANLSKKTVSLQASALPNGAVNNELTWKSEWVNPNDPKIQSAKTTDFIMITPTSKGADITLLKNFDSQIKIIVELKSNPGIFKECYVDNMQKVESISYTTHKVKPQGNKGNYSLEYNLTETSKGDNTNYSIGIDPATYNHIDFADYDSSKKYSVDYMTTISTIFDFNIVISDKYTIKNDKFKLGNPEIIEGNELDRIQYNIKLSFTNEFESFIKENNLIVRGNPDFNYNCYYKNKDRLFFIDNMMTNLTSNKSSAFSNDMFDNFLLASASLFKKDSYFKLYNLLDNYSGYAFEVTVDFYEAGSYTLEQKLKLNKEMFKPIAKDIQLDQGEIVM